MSVTELFRNRCSLPHGLPKSTHLLLGTYHGQRTHLHFWLQGNTGSEHGGEMMDGVSKVMSGLFGQY
jgi:hypothetical protein